MMRCTYLGRIGGVEVCAAEVVQDIEEFGRQRAHERQVSEQPHHPPQQRQRGPAGRREVSEGVSE
jgi:hypothetical protein